MFVLVIVSAGHEEGWLNFECFKLRTTLSKYFTFRCFMVLVVVVVVMVVVVVVVVI
jgi:hypothetical protein